MQAVVPERCLLWPSSRADDSRGQSQAEGDYRRPEYVQIRVIFNMVCVNGGVN